MQTTKRITVSLRKTEELNLEELEKYFCESISSVVCRCINEMHEKYKEKIFKDQNHN